jgi:type I restriction-modification system DNA methylase subunit
MWNKILNKLNDHSHMSEINRDSYRIKMTAEIFTPSELVIEMLKKTPLEYFSSGKLTLDPACGDGQFLTAIKWVKIYAFDMKEDEALRDLYGVDIMRDNVDLCKKRLGGGTIIMGDSLNPNKKLENQTEDESNMMITIFDSNPLIDNFVDVPDIILAHREPQDPLDAL